MTSLCCNEYGHACVGVWSCVRHWCCWNRLHNFSMSVEWCHTGVIVSHVNDKSKCLFKILLKRAIKENTKGHNKDIVMSSLQSIWRDLLQLVWHMRYVYHDISWHIALHQTSTDKHWMMLKHYPSRTWHFPFPGLDLSNRSDIWRALQQQHYRDACQISERYDNYDIKCRCFKTSRDLAVTRPSA